MSLSSSAAFITPPTTPSRKASPKPGAQSSAGSTLSTPKMRGTNSPAVDEVNFQQLEVEHVSHEPNPHKQSPDGKSVAENPFGTDRGRILFEAIDQLQALEYGRNLHIPQLVVVGLQSSGKSSLLQTLTGIPFPVGGGCCTRFPTRIISQRTPPGSKDTFRISIGPAEVKIEGMRKAPQVEKYNHTGTTLTSEMFAQIINEVESKYMGISPGTNANSKNFATEVLKVELSGPNRSYFSILDLPGAIISDSRIFQSDRHNIVSMITQYMKKPENTVICVLDGSNDPTNQPIMELAAEHVADRRRLLGVLTKCDRLCNNPSEALGHIQEFANKRTSVVRYVPGSDHMILPDGWFVVRNRLDRESDKVDLDAIEKEFFSTYPWNLIPLERRGSSSLKTHLGGVLDSQIQSSFPVIRDTIIKELEAKKAEKKLLGEPRESQDQMRTYVHDVVREFEKKTTMALDKPQSLEMESMRIRCHVWNLNLEFDDFMRQRGATWEFQNYFVNPQARLAELVNGTVQQNEIAQDISSELNPVFQSCWPMEDSKALLEKIEEKLTKFRAGQLPGIINPDIFPTMFHLQVEKWPKIAEIHLGRVKDVVASAIKDILESVCPSTGGTAKLHSGLEALLQPSFFSAGKTVDELYNIGCEQETKCKLLQTTNSNFGNDVVAWRKIRFHQAGTQAVRPGDTPAEVLSRCFELAHPSLQNNMVNEVHDVLKVYYKLALESFIRTMNHLVESYVDGEGGPVKALRSETIMKLSKEKLIELAGEDETTLMRRKALNKEIDELEGALSIVMTAGQRLERLVSDSEEL